ncbi:hypothetical protein C2E23DRAFT_917823 [Lenzites betulinus]|nr:hypothetical protein C2E23DRAFT_917823 [Lenzites betulinus]
MSGLPPQLDTTLPGTPSTEWARSTTTAAFSRTDPAPALGATTTTTTTTTPSVPPPTTVTGGSISAADGAQKAPFDAKAFNVSPATPGAEFPGAYPATPGEPGPQLQPPATETVLQTAQNAASTASGYMQSAAGAAAQYLPQGVVDTVSSYMPTSSATATMSTARASAHDAEHTTSLPSREVAGAAAGERTGGVGALPGPRDEAAVTKLPDERVDAERYTTTAAAAASLAAGAYALKDRVAGALPSAQDAQAATDSVQAKAQSTAQTVKQAGELIHFFAAPAIPGLTSTSTHSTAVTASTLPTREHFGAQPGDHSSGAGALPGLLEEPHVARLPEESAHPQYDSGPMDTAAQVALKPTEEAFGNEKATGDARRVGGVGALVGGRDESSVALAPDERAGQTASGVLGTNARTLPSQEPLGNEAVGATKRVDGVGALVGNFNESGAAVLPDERARGQGTGTGTVAQPTKKADAPSVPPKDDDDAAQKADAGGEKHLSDKSGAHGAPNKHTRSGDPGTGCFCATERDEQGRPREAQASMLRATLRPRAHALGAERAVWGRAPLSGVSARAELDGDYDGSHAEGSGYETDYHPADMHPAAEGSIPTEHVSEGEKSAEGASQSDSTPEKSGVTPEKASEKSAATPETAPEKEPAPPQEKAKKAGFMDKMRGEAKVLLGKLEHKPAKVEQGQRLKAGEGAPAST